MNVFYFVNRWPRYNLSAQADKILSNIQTLLNIGHQVSIFSADTAPEQNLADLNQIPVEIVTVNQNKISQSLTGSARKPDLILYNSVEMEQLYSIFLYSKWSKCPKVLQLNNLKGVSEWRQLNYPTESGFIHQYDSQASPKQLQELFQSQQLSSILRSDYYFCANDYISDYLRRKLKINNYIVNSIGVPTLEFLKEIDELQFRQFRHRKNFAFLGSFTSKKNLQMINTLIKQIWPLIRNQIKGVQLYVYGSGYNKTLFSKKKQLQKIGVFLKGFVEDTEQIQKHRAVLYPLRSNCCLKGAISEAWFQHTPVVTTPIGAEGYFLQTSQPRYSALADGRTFSGFFKERQLSKEQLESEKNVKDYYSSNRLSESINKLSFGGVCNSFSYQQFAANAIKIYTDEEFWQSCLSKSRKSLLKNQSELQLQTNLRFGLSQVQYSTFQSRKKKQYSQQWSRYIKSTEAYNRLSQRKGKF